MTRRSAALVPIIFIASLAASGGGCGGSDPLGPSGPEAGAPSPSPAALPAPSPSPLPTPTPAPADVQPEPSPSPACIHDVDHRVESVSLALYFVECNGRRVALNEHNDVPLGCRIHLNATPRNGMNAPTCSQTWPEWQVDPAGLVGGRDGETFTPVYQARDLGRVSIRCIVDNVRSNWVFFNLVPN